MSSGQEATNALRQAAASGEQAAGFYTRAGRSETTENTARSIARALDLLGGLKAELREGGTIHHGARVVAESLSEGDSSLTTARAQVVAAVGPDNQLAAVPSGIMDEVTSSAHAAVTEVMDEGDVALTHVVAAYDTLERIGILYSQATTTSTTAEAASRQFSGDATAMADGMESQ